MTPGDILALLSLFGWFYLAFFHGAFWKPLLPPYAPAPEAWPSVDIIVPARDEAGMLPQSLPSLLEQQYQGEWRILVVNDHSTDGTGAVARKLAEQKGGNRVTVIDAPELPPNWKNGKLAAMQAGVDQSSADYILFTDADIWHPEHNLRELAARAESFKLDLVSMMASLHCETFAEKLLIPAFVLFFAALYPFRRANDQSWDTAAAAGGVILVKRAALDKIGGLKSIKSQLIDDCALARAIKDGGGLIELTLAPEVESLRVYPEIKDVWQMVVRTAFTQLGHSPLYLLITILSLGFLFLVPIAMMMFGGFIGSVAGFGAWMLMLFLYWPMTSFYRLSLAWTVLLPAAAVIYMAATVNSARLYWQGKGGKWKGRVSV